MGVPGLVVAEFDLDQRDTGLDESEGHQQRSAEAVATVALLRNRPADSRCRAEELDRTSSLDSQPDSYAVNRPISAMA